MVTRERDSRHSASVKTKERIMGDTRLTSVALAFDGDFFVLAFYFSLDFGWQPYMRKSVR